jgi:glycopeptide antibiotics resistance protein
MRPPGVLDLAPGIVLGYLPVALAVLALAGAALFGVRSRRASNAIAARTTILDLAVVTWLALVLLVTVVPIGRSGGQSPFAVIPFLDVFDRIASGFSTPLVEAPDIVYNVVLFMPFGVWAALRFGRPWMVATIAAGAILSLGVEASQLFEATGRDAGLTDVVSNTVGITAGCLLGLVIRRAIERRDP